MLGSVQTLQILELGLSFASSCAIRKLLALNDETMPHFPHI